MTFFFSDDEIETTLPQLIPFFQFQSADFNNWSAEME